MKMIRSDKQLQKDIEEQKRLLQDLKEALDDVKEGRVSDYEFE